MLLFSGAALLPHAPANAAEALKYGTTPAWVAPKAIPDAATTSAPVAPLLYDQQISFEGGKITIFTETAFRIQTSEGLSAGNVSIIWQPATETVTVHKLRILRSGKVIDVLANGQTFTVLRRETNLEAATLDGTLTANIQPEGLQQGDIVNLATTIEHADPVLKGHTEATFAAWNDLPIELGHAAVSWPSGLKVNVRQSGPLPTPVKSVRGGKTIFELSSQKIEPAIPPKSAPRRFAIGRLAEASDYSSWADIANLMAPLYRTAAVIPATGPLHDEVERIRASTPEPKKRAEEALALVQDRVRYVALLMGAGGYVPASAETSWSRRFGDCKAKTALLLAILHSLGIEAEPVLVQSKMGDAIVDRLPMVALFDHVLVRSHIGGKVYWLDGTRSGDAALDDIQTPNFGWGLPVVANASLVRIVPAPLERPNSDRRIEIDATEGVLAPATISISTSYRGDVAVYLNSLYAQATAAQRDEALRNEANKLFNNFAMASSSIQFDKANRQITITQKGTAKLNWKEGWFNVPATSLGYNPDLQRAQGPMHDAPFATEYPNYEHNLVTIRLPRSYEEQQQRSPDPVSTTLLGVEYRRSTKRTGNLLSIESSERTIVPEVPYKDAVAAETRLRKLADDDVYLRIPSFYRPTSKDAAALSADKPTSAAEYFERGRLLLHAEKYDDAIADFTQALELDPKNAAILAERGLARVWKSDFTSADKDLSAAQAIEPDNAVMLRARGLSAEMNNDCAKALGFLTRSLAKEVHTFSFGHRAYCESELKKYDEALADSEQALKTNPSWTELRLLRTNIFMRQNRRDLAAAEVERLTRENPGSDYAWVVAAKTYSALGQREKAMQAIDRGLAVQPAAYIYINRAEIRTRSDVAGRRADLDAALKLEPESADALFAKSSLLSETGDYQGALAILDRIKLDHASSWSDLQRAILLHKSDRTAEAQKLFRSARAKATKAVEFNNLCWEKAVAGVMLESALDDCREALKLSPGAGAYLDSLGMVLLKLGRLDEALEAYNQAVAKDTGAATFMGRALVYLRKGDQARAESDAAAARRLHADIDAKFAGYGLSFAEPMKTAGK